MLFREVLSQQKDTTSLKRQAEQDMGPLSKPQTLTYRGETWQIAPALDAWGNPVIAAFGGPLYDLLDASGQRCYTLWWARGRRTGVGGRLLTIQAYTDEHPYPLGVWRRGESFSETPAGIVYLDDRYRAVVNRMPLTEQVKREVKEQGESIDAYIARQVDACLAEGVLTLAGEPDPQATRKRWIEDVIAVFRANTRRR